ncbi:MAG: GYF domain-containing protein [Bdellovibrionales bacterium]
MKYLVSHQGQQVGPFTLNEVVAKVRSKDLDLFDYIFDENKQDWILLMEHAPLANALKSNKPPAPPHVGTGTTAAPALTSTHSAPPVARPEPKSTPSSRQASVTPSTAVLAAAPTSQLTSAAMTEAVSPVATDSAHVVTQWFVLKGENRFGPFTYLDVVRMLQQKVVFPFDLLWHAGLKEWQRLASFEEFSPGYIRDLFAASGNKGDVFVQRKFKRTKFSGRVIIHDNLKLWTGEGIEISRGGVGVSMRNALVVPGQQLFIHFTGREGWPAFNAVCEVVSKKLVNDNSPIEYGLRFLSMNQDVQDELYRKVA